MAQSNTISPNEQPFKRPHRTRNRWLAAIAIVFVAIVIALGIAAEYIAHHAGPLLRSSVIATLSDRFHSPVELDSLDVSVAKGLQVHGHGLRIFYLAGPTQPDLKQKQGMAAPPMLTVNDFTFRTTFHDLLHMRANITRVDIDGLDLNIPPHTGGRILHVPDTRSRIALTVGKIYCKNVNLVIETSRPDKEPMKFAIQNLELTDVGPDRPMLYVADVINPKPIGKVHASGHFGPWRGDDPRATPIDGNYTFTNVELNSIKGLGGTLSSTGQFGGHLSHINVDGTTATPNFSLDISGHPLPLETTFHAFVDGTNGDTTLDPVVATLGHSQFTARGVVMHIHDKGPSGDQDKEKGHDIALTVDMPSGRIEDLLQLSMKTEPPAMRGGVTLQARIHIPPGDVRVAKKMQLAGALRIRNVEFGSSTLQDRIDGLSMRAQGKLDEVKAADSDRKPEVSSQMAVDFSLDNNIMTIGSLHYQIPGAQVNLVGVDFLDGNIFEFKGHVRTEATASQMVTGWKSALLKPFDGMFKKDGAGLQLPVQVSGTGSSYKLGFAMHGSDDTPQQIEAELKDHREGRPD